MISGIFLLFYIRDLKIQIRVVAPFMGYLQKFNISLILSASTQPHTFHNKRR